MNLRTITKLTLALGCLLSVLYLASVPGENELVTTTSAQQRGLITNICGGPATISGIGNAQGSCGRCRNESGTNGHCTPQDGEVAVVIECGAKLDTNTHHWGIECAGAQLGVHTQTFQSGTKVNIGEYLKNNCSVQIDIFKQGMEFSDPAAGGLVDFLILYNPNCTGGSTPTQYEPVSDPPANNDNPGQPDNGEPDVPANQENCTPGQKYKRTGSKDNQGRHLCDCYEPEGDNSSSGDRGYSTISENGNCIALDKGVAEDYGTCSTETVGDRCYAEEFLFNSIIKMRNIYVESSHGNTNICEDLKDTPGNTTGQSTAGPFYSVRNPGGSCLRYSGPRPEDCTGPHSPGSKCESHLTDGKPEYYMEYDHTSDTCGCLALATQSQVAVCLEGLKNKPRTTTSTSTNTSTDEIVSTIETFDTKEQCQGEIETPTSPPADTGTNIPVGVPGDIYISHLDRDDHNGEGEIYIIKESDPKHSLVLRDCPDMFTNNFATCILDGDTNHIFYREASEEDSSNACSHATASLGGMDPYIDSEKDFRPFSDDNRRCSQIYINAAVYSPTDNCAKRERLFYNGKNKDNVPADYDEFQDKGEVTVFGTRYFQTVTDCQKAVGRPIVTNPDSELLTASVLGADDADLTVSESGRYTLFKDGQPVTEKDIIVTESELKVVLFEDLNGNGVKETVEPFIPPADYSAYKIGLDKDTRAVNYELSAGWNLINIPLVDNRADTPVKTASALIDYWNTQGAEITHVAKFTDGRFSIYSKRESGAEFAPDFNLIPGEGLFVYNNTNARRVTFSGKGFSDPVPIEFASGWNLVGVISPKKEYNSEAFLKALAGKEVPASTISQFENGRYLSVVYEDNLLYGNNYKLTELRGYFIKLEGTGGQRFTP